MKTSTRFTRISKLTARAALALGVATILTSQIHATDGTWANPAYTSGTFTGVGSGGQFTFPGTALAVGDVIQATQAASGLNNNTLYYVVGVSGTTYTLSATPGGTPLATSLTTTVTFNAALDWSSTASWTSGSVPSGTDAVATIATVSGTPNSYNIIIDADMTVGQIIASQNNKQWSLVSSNNNGSGTALAALNFATTGATPGGPLIQTNTQLLRVGFNDASFKGGSLKITGSQGLTLVSGASTEIRLETIDWSGFTDGAGGAGTVTVQSGKVANMGNGLGTATTCTNLVVGNSSSSASAKAEMAVNNQGDLTINNLDGNQYGYVSGPTTNIKWLYIGQRNGTNTDFTGTIGTDRAGTAAPVVLVKNGTGTQTISGTIANGTVTVNAGTLTLGGTNTYAGGTTLAVGTLNVNSTTALGGAAGAITLNGGTIDNTSGSAKTLANNQAITLGGNLAFGGSNDLNLGTGAIANGGNRTLTLNGTGKTLTLGGIMTNTQAGNQTTTINGAGNSLVLGGYALSNGAANYANIINGSGNVSITGPITDGGTATACGLTYSGTGTLTLGGSNSYNGATIIMSGNVTLGSATGLGASSTPATDYTSLRAATLDLNGQTIAEKIWIDNAAAVLANSNAMAAAITTDIGLSSNLTVDTTGDILAPRMIATATRTITKIGTGTLTTSGSTHNNLTAWDIQAGTVVFANTSGYGADRGVLINGGTLQLSGANSNLINDGQPFTITSGIYDLNGKGEAVAAITGAGGTIRNSNATTATLYVGGGVAGSSSGTYNGLIENGTGVLNVTKEGTGTQTLTGINTYTGASTVNNGVLQAGASSAFGTGIVAIANANGTLDLNGQNIANTVNISAAGKLINSSVMAAELTANANVTSGFTVETTGNITIPRLIATGAPRTVTKIGTATLTTNGNNHNNLTAWDIQAGTVVFANTAGYGADRGVTLNGGTLILSGANNNLLNNSENVTVHSGTFDLNGKTEAIGALIAAAAGGIVTNSNATAATLYVGGSTGGTASGTYAGAIQDGVGALNLTKEGSGTQVMTGTLAYSGTTTVSTGVLSLGTAGLNDFSTVDITSGAALQLTHAAIDDVAVLKFNGVPQPDGIYDQSNSGGQVIGSGSIRVGGTTGSFASWASTNGAAGQSASDDHDNDGVPNGIEYFMGESGSSFTTNPGITGGSIIWPKSTGFSGTYRVETSTTLENGSWTDVTSEVDDIGTSVSYLVDMSGPTLFVRLVVIPN